jgi:glycosyltransferase involved in cell wall biosynthesis
MITIVTPSFADEANTNAQNLSVKEIVARLDPERFAVTMLQDGAADPRIASRPNTRLLRWRARGNTVWTAWHLLRNVPDIYFFPREGPLDAAFLTFRRTLKLKTAVVSYVVSGGLNSQPYSPARMRHIREADAVFANNTYLGQLLKERTGIEAAGIIYDGVDRRYYFEAAAGGKGNDRVTALFAGSLRPYKRVPLVVQQAKRWPEMQFRIAGVGEEEAVCRNLANELGCSNVEFTGHLSQSQLAEEMRQADIFLFPSVIEGHPQVLVQAAACGLPIVAMNIYRPDFVVDGVTGFLAESYQEFAGKFELLAQSRELRRQMGRAAVAHVQQYDWDAITKIWERAFEMTVERRRISAGSEAPIRG